MRISILLPDLRGGGVERIRLILAHEFAKQGHIVEFLLQNAVGELMPEASTEFRVVDFAVRRARDLARCLVNHLRSDKPDVLLVAMWPLTAIAPVAARFARFGGRVIVTEHAILSRQYEGWGRLHRLALRGSTMIAYRLASARVGVSRGVAEDMSFLSWMTDEQFKIIHNPIRSLNFPQPNDLDKIDELWNTAGPRILTVGNLNAVKNQAVQIRAFARLGRPDARLMFLGQGQEEQRLRRLAAELGIANRVIFAGFHSDPSLFYATADLFVLSSAHEGFGNVIVEALSFGLPVVSTDCPSGPAEILENGRWGRLTPVGDVEALARSMDEALSSPVDRAGLKRRAADFSPEIAARKYLDLLGLS